jgi:hypothetical protein
MSHRGKRLETPPSWASIAAFGIAVGRDKPVPFAPGDTYEPRHNSDRFAAGASRPGAAADCRLTAARLAAGGSHALACDLPGNETCWLNSKSCAGEAIRSLVSDGWG